MSTNLFTTAGLKSDLTGTTHLGDVGLFQGFTLRKVSVPDDNVELQMKTYQRTGRAVMDEEGFEYAKEAKAVKAIGEDKSKTAPKRRASKAS